MKNTGFFVLLLLFVLPCQASDTVLATIGETKITANNLKKFAKNTVNLRSYLSIPNGPERLLKIIIEQKLLVQEGQDRQINRPSDGQNDDLVYAQTVQSKLLQPCGQPTESQLKRFYYNSPKLFSTPFYIRTRRISLKAKTDEEVKIAKQKITEIKENLENT